MFNFFKIRAERKKNETHELELRRALKEKLSLWEQQNLVPKSEDADFTEITVEGNHVRVQKTNITVHDVTSNTFFAKPKWRMV